MFQKGCVPGVGVKGRGYRFHVLRFLATTSSEMSRYWLSHAGRLACLMHLIAPPPGGAPGSRLLLGQPTQKDPKP